MTPSNGNGNGRKQFWAAISFIPVALIVGAIFHSGFYVGNVMANTRDNRSQDVKISCHEKDLREINISVIRLEGEVEVHYKEILALLRSQSDSIKNLRDEIKDIRTDLKDLH